MPVHTGKASRTYGTVLIDKGNPSARGSSKPVTRKFDVEHYNLTGQIRYLDEVEGDKAVIVFNYCRRKKKHCKDVKGCKYLPDGKCGHMSIGQEGVPAPSNSAPSEPEGAPEDDCTTHAVSMACTPNLNEVERFFEEPQPNLSEAIKPKFLKFESEKDLAMELVAAVTTRVTLQIKAELRQKIADYFKDAWQVLAEADTGRKVDELYIAIQRELLTDVENGVFERLGEGGING